MKKRWLAIGMIICLLIGGLPVGNLTGLGLVDVYGEEWDAYLAQLYEMTISPYDSGVAVLTEGGVTWEISRVSYNPTTGDIVGVYPTFIIEDFTFITIVGVRCDESVTELVIPSFLSKNQIVVAIEPGALRKYGVAEHVTSIEFPYGAISSMEAAVAGLHGGDKGSMLRIYDDIFSECPNLKSITIPKTMANIEGVVEYIKKGNLGSLETIRFSGTEEEWKALKSASVSDNTLWDANPVQVEYEYGMYTDPETGIKWRYRELPDGTVAVIRGCELGDDAIDLEIPEKIAGRTVSQIGESAFRDCNVLTGISMPDTVTTIGPWAFQDCFNVKKCIVSDNVAIIGKHAFSELGRDTEFEYFTTRNNVGLDCFTIPKNVKTLNAFAFLYFPFESITIPVGLEFVHSKAIDLNRIQHINYMGTQEQCEENEIKCAFEHRHNGIDCMIAPLLGSSQITFLGSQPPSGQSPAGITITDEDGIERTASYNGPVTLTPEVTVGDGGRYRSDWEVFEQNESGGKIPYDDIMKQGDVCTISRIRKPLTAVFSVWDAFGEKKTKSYMISLSGGLAVTVDSDSELTHEPGDAVTLKAKATVDEDALAACTWTGTWSGTYGNVSGNDLPYPDGEITADGLSCTIRHLRPNTQVTVTIEDSEGNRASDMATVGVRSDFRVEGSMENTVYVRPGDNATLQVKASPREEEDPLAPEQVSDEAISIETVSGNEVSEVQTVSANFAWYQDGVPIKGKTADTLELKGCRKTEEYQCHVTDEKGVTTVVTYYVKMHDGLTCDYGEGENILYVYEGKSVTIAPQFVMGNMVSDTSYKTLSYDWYLTDKNYRILDQLQKGIDAYTVENVKTSVRLKVIAKNSYGVVAERDFKVVPTRSLSLCGTETITDSIPAGAQETVLKADAVSRPGGSVKFEWYELSGGNLIAMPGKTETLTMDEDGRVCGQITVPAGKKSYKCVVTDLETGKKAEKMFCTYVDTGLKVLSQSGGGEVAPGSGISLSVNAIVDEGYTLSYDWKNGDGSDAGASAKDEPEYEIEPVTSGGEYVCTVSDGAGNSEKAMFEVKVENGFSVGDIHASTLFKKHNAAIAKNMEGNIGLYVSATSQNISGLSYQWYHGESYAPDRGDYAYTLLESGFEKGICRPSESGAYKVVVSDQYQNRQERTFYIDRYVAKGKLEPSADSVTLTADDPKAFYYYEVKPDELSNYTFHVSSEQNVDCYLYDGNWKILGQERIENEETLLERPLSNGKTYYALIVGDGETPYTCDIALEKEVSNSESGGDSGGEGGNGSNQGGSQQGGDTDLQTTPGAGGQTGAGAGNTPEEKAKLALPKLSLTLAKKNELKLTISNYTEGASYEIYRSTDGKKYSKLKTISASSYTDKKLKNGKTYYYKVCAVSGGEQTGYSDTVSKKIVTSLKKPAISAVRKGGSYYLQWKQVPNATQYLVQYKVGKEKYKVLKKLKAKKTSADITKVLVGKSGTIRFKVTAVYKSGKIQIKKDSKELVARK